LIFEKEHNVKKFLLGVISLGFASFASAQIVRLSELPLMVRLFPPTLPADEFIGLAGLDENKNNCSVLVLMATWNGPVRVAKVVLVRSLVHATEDGFSMGGASTTFEIDEPRHLNGLSVNRRDQVVLTFDPMTQLSYGQLKGKPIVSFSIQGATGASLAESVANGSLAFSYSFHGLSGNENRLGMRCTVRSILPNKP